jgi:hypothetical protein
VEFTIPIPGLRSIGPFDRWSIFAMSLAILIVPATSAVIVYLYDIFDHLLSPSLHLIPFF